MAEILRGEEPQEPLSSVRRATRHDVALWLCPDCFCSGVILTYGERGLRILQQIVDQHAYQNFECQRARIAVFKPPN